MVVLQRLNAQNLNPKARCAEIHEMVEIPRHGASEHEGMIWLLDPEHQIRSYISRALHQNVILETAISRSISLPNDSSLIKRYMPTTIPLQSFCPVGLSADPLGKQHKVQNTGFGLARLLDPRWCTPLCTVQGHNRNMTSAKQHAKQEP